MAVVDFTDLQGNVTELGRFLAEQLSVALADVNPDVRVVDRTHLKTLMREYRLASSGIIDPASAQKLGQITGVEILVTGTLTPFGDSVKISAKALETKTAVIVASANADIPRTRAIDELLNRGLSAGTGSDTLKPALNRDSASVPPAQTVEANGFSFLLSSCKLSSDTLICSFQIINRRDDRRLVIMANYSSRSRIIDSSGHEYPGGETRLGSNSYGGRASNGMVRGVSVAATLTFPRVPSPVASIALLEISCYAEGIMENNGHFSVQFRDVPVTRE